jgi:DNA polymerase III subunit epsilon
LYAVVDIESTGGHYHKDRIIEIAIVIYDGKEIIEEFTTLLNPLRPIGPFIQTLTGISNNMVVDAPTFEEVADTILRLTENKVFVGHNARFDYGFVKAEFRRMGIPFRRQQICTVNLSRSIIPGFRSYSLGKLCQDLGIAVDYRHRAFGDAAATARLLGVLLQQDVNGQIQQALQEHSTPTGLPAQLAVDTIHALPEEPGVFYFHDKDHKTIFICRGKNVREKTLQLFASENGILLPDDLRSLVADISFELTGNDLVASLLEAAEIQRYAPRFNAVPRMKQFNYGLYSYMDEHGYMKLQIAPMEQSETRPLLKFSSRARGDKFIERIQEFIEAMPSKRKVETPQSINQRLNKALTKHLYHYPSFLIVDMGRSGEERSVIWIQDEEVRGYGYFDPKDTGSHIHSILDVIKPIRETPEMRKMIIEYVRKNSKVIDIIPLDD